MSDTPGSAQDAPDLQGAGHALRDIEEQLQSSQKRAAQLAAVNHIARVLNTTLDVEQVYTAFASEMRQVLGYDWIGLGLLNEQGQTVLHLSMGQPLAGWRPGHIFQVDDIPLAWASHHERALLRQDLFSPNLVHPFAQDTPLTGAGLRTDVTVPLYLQDRCAGAWMLASQERESYTADDLQILRQAVEQLAIAVENARLYEQERKQAQDLVEISRLVREAASVLDIERQLEIIGRAQSLFARGTLDIGLLEGSDVHWYKPDRTTQADIAPLVKQALATGRSQSWIDNPQGPAMLAVPLYMAGQTKGVMTLYSPPGQTLGHAELNLLETLAAQASVTLDNTRLIEMTMHQGALLEQRANRLAHILDTSYDVLRLNPQTKDLEAQICTIAQEALGFQVVAIYVLNAQASTLTLRAVAGPGLTAQDRRALCSQTYPLSELDELLHPRSRISHSYYVRYDDLSARAAPIRPLYRSTDSWLGKGHWHPQDMLLAPIETPAGKAVGYFLLSQPQDSRTPNLETVQTVEIFVNQAAIALENARLFAALEERLNQARRVNELGALNRLSTAVTSSLQADSILNAAHQEIGRTLRPDWSAIWLLQPTPTRTQGPHRPTLRRRGHRPQDGIPHPNVMGHAGRSSAPDLSRLVPSEVIETAVREGAPIRLDGSQASPTFAPPDPCDDAPGRRLPASALLAPMIVRDQKIGLIGAFAVPGQAFDDQDLALLHSMASTVAIAIENARLYAESKAFAKELAASQAQLLQNTKLAATGKLAATIAHEINNPLQALQSCMYLIADGAAPDDPNARYANMARDELDRIARIVGRMLDFYQPATEAQEPTDLNLLIENTLALVHKRLQHSHIRVQVDLAPHLSPIYAVPDHIKQVLLNLILNAIEAMPDGGDLGIRTTQADLEWVHMAIRDTGIGIEPDGMANLFEPFYTSKPHGTGLGLSVSYDLIARHRGQILVDSTPGRGTTFTLHLPAHRGTQTWNKNEQGREPS